MDHSYDSFLNGMTSVPCINWFPGHMAKSLKELRTKMKKADAVVEIRDARVSLPSLARKQAYCLSQHLRRSHSRPPILYSMNFLRRKICPASSFSISWILQIPSHHRYCVQVRDNKNWIDFLTWGVESRDILQKAVSTRRVWPCDCPK